MELRLLRYFLTVARFESISRAADVLHITQPTLSRQLMNLEEELGAKLLIRGKKKVSLTEDGVLLRQRAEEILALSDRTKLEFQSRVNLVGGVLSVGCAESKASKFLGKMIREFSEQYPEVKYHLFSGIADDILPKLDQGLFEIALLIQPINTEKYDFIRLPQTEKFGIITYADSALAKKPYVTRDDLIDEPLFTSQRTLVQGEIAQWFGEIYEYLQVKGTYTLVFNVLSLVEQGVGTAICIDGVFDKRHTEFAFVPLHPEVVFGCVIAWRKHITLSQTAVTFLQQIRTALNNR